MMIFGSRFCSNIFLPYRTRLSIFVLVSINSRFCLRTSFLASLNAAAAECCSASITDR